MHIPEKLAIFLNQKVEQYNTPDFIAADPICIPHSFTQKQDIEIAAFFAALFAWGNRTTIINKGRELMQLMENAPYDFCKNHKEEDLKPFLDFKHRTFTPTDILFFLSFFKTHYNKHDSLELAFAPKKLKATEDIGVALDRFYGYVFSHEDAPARTRKHVAAPSKKATCKRLCMYLRWMVRDDNKGVDFGIWRNIKPAQLMIPLDLHVSRVARQFGMIERKATDWATVQELTATLKQLDPKDPAKYDYALFALGVLEKFS